MSVPSSGMSAAPLNMCSHEIWALSRLPSIVCTQLHIASCFRAYTCSAGSEFGAEVAKRRHRVAGPQIRPHHATGFPHRIRRQSHPVPERARRRLTGHVDARAVGVEFPAVIRAPQATFLVAAEIQRGTPVRAVLGDQPDRAGRVPERHQILAEQPNPHRCTVRLGNLHRQQGGRPVTPQQFAHRRARPDPRQDVVVLLGEHPKLPSGRQYAKKLATLSYHRARSDRWRFPWGGRNDRV